MGLSTPTPARSKASILRADKGGENSRAALSFNTPSGKGARTDEGKIRAAAVSYGVPCVTTLPGCLAVVRAIEAIRVNPNLEVQALQDWFKALN